jgi:hypothetical protein
MRCKAPLKPRRFVSDGKVKLSRANHFGFGQPFDSVGLRVVTRQPASQVEGVCGLRSRPAMPLSKLDRFLVILGVFGLMLMAIQYAPYLFVLFALIALWGPWWKDDKKE